jgi:hypothetical protein
MRHIRISNHSNHSYTAPAFGLVTSPGDASFNCLLTIGDPSTYVSTSPNLTFLAPTYGINSYSGAFEPGPRKNGASNAFAVSIGFKVTGRPISQNPLKVGITKRIQIVERIVLPIKKRQSDLNTLRVLV